MNFFEHQDAARRKTGRLILLFGLAVVVIILAVYLVFATVMALGLKKNRPHDPRAPHAAVTDELRVADFWSPQLFGATAVGVGLLISAGSLYRIATLGSGGKGIAALLGGRLLSTSTTNLHERRLLNVVEEMALASGMPVPPVYVLDDERTINAFAAGFTPSDAVVGVTRGTIEKLNRDELQGVIAHEFSHIFNGDMRLNLRLIGVLHGILLISMIGYLMFRIAAEVRPRRSSGKNNAGGLILAILAVGAALYVLGYIGVFFGHLIKSAVSRQREFLADASAVQFTRDPNGIGGALKKLGALGSRLKAKQAEQASHLFFGNGVKEAWFNLTATHPPLADRIRRIDADFNGVFAAGLKWPDDTPETAFTTPPPLPQRRFGVLPPIAAAGVSQLSADEALADVGAPQPQHLDFAAQLLAGLPADLLAETHEPVGAACVVYALLLHDDPADDEPELRRLAESISPEVADRVRRLIGPVSQIPPLARLPLAQLTMSALRQLTPPQYELFHRAIIQLIRADRRVSLFEYGVHRLIIRRLGDYFTSAPPVFVEHTTIDAVADSVAALFSKLAEVGHPADAAARQAAYAAGRAVVGEVAPRPIDGLGFSAIDQALDELAASSGAVKQRVLQGCAAVIAHDDRLTIDEAELLRTVADALDCPMPPPAARTLMS